MVSLESFLTQGREVSTAVRQARSGQLVHANLITGGPGLGKWSLARSLAAALLCQGEAKKPCGQCAACRQVESMTHPDLITIELGKPLVPTRTKQSIPLTDIHEMIRLTSLHGYEGERRVVLIRHAEDMTADAQNALLKTLEEPPAGVWFLLTCRNMNLLLPTIVSRCRQLRLHPWDDDAVKQVLADHFKEVERAEQKINGTNSEQSEMEERAKRAERAKRTERAVAVAGGSPGEALKIADDDSFWTFQDEVIRDFLGCERRSDILGISGRWKDRKDESGALFTVLDSILNQLMHCSIGLMDDSILSEVLPKKWKQLSMQADPEWFGRLVDAVSLARKRAEANVNFQSVTEQLILALMEASDR